MPIRRRSKKMKKILILVISLLFLTSSVYALDGWQTWVHKRKEAISVEKDKKCKHAKIDLKELLSDLELLWKENGTPEYKRSIAKSALQAVKDKLDYCTESESEREKDLLLLDDLEFTYNYEDDYIANYGK
jgi:hypothetical protein